jgi:hypothetical protein
MIEIMIHIGNNTFTGNYKPDQSISVKRKWFKRKKRNIFQTLSKYILENNKIIFLT